MDYRYSSLLIMVVGELHHWGFSVWGIFLHVINNNSVQSVVKNTTPELPWMT